MNTKESALPGNGQGTNNNGNMGTTDNNSTELKLFGMEIGLSRWNKEPAPPDWLVDNLLHRNIISILDGIGDSGKSIFAMQLALDIATGSHFLEHYNFRCKKGKVIYLNAEDPDSQMHIRYKKMTQDFSEEMQADIQQNLTVVPFLSLNSSPRLMKKSKGENNPTPAFGELFNFCHKWQPDLVILDPLAYFGNIEGDSEDVIDLYDMMKKLKATILLLHHQNKAAMNDRGEMNQRAKARGSSAITENAKLRMSLEKEMLIIDKHNYGKKMTMALDFEREQCRWKMNNIIEGIMPGGISKKKKGDF
jgi:RecA-family ATPase